MVENLFNKWSVIQIKPSETYDWLINIHYAKRIPSISYAFGLYVDDELCGIVTYGTPSSSALRKGIAGEKNSKYILELNRLCFYKQIKNAASFLVSNSLRLLPKPSIVVSYADTDQGHIGYVYQASNFIYTGLSAKRTDWKVKGMEHLHGQTIADIGREICKKENISRSEYMKRKFGDDFYLKDRPRKHRYIYIVGNSIQKKVLLSEIKYKQKTYPKGESKKYDISNTVTKQKLLNLNCA
jgi:hypothetical protein